MQPNLWIDSFRVLNLDTQVSDLEQPYHCTKAHPRYVTKHAHMQLKQRGYNIHMIVSHVYMLIQSSEENYLDEA